MRTTLIIQGARENNLQGVTVEIPRNALTVITGVSGSGKSSLAFDTLYAEGQRRLLASMSSYAKRFVHQLRKPDVDFVHGLSPVVSIDQKTVGSNPRSTVGTMTDVWDYLRMLFATLGRPRCPWCEEEVAVRSPHQMLEHLFTLPAGTEVELRAPVFEIYGESWETVLEQVRVQGYRRVRVDGESRDLGDEWEIDDDTHPQVEAILDCFAVGEGIDRAVLSALEHGRKVGDGFFSFHPDGISAAKRKRFHSGFGCKEHRLLSATLHHGDFTFNDPAGACQTCMGIGTTKRVHPTLLVPDPTRSLRGGAIVKEAFNNDVNTWGGRWLHSLAQHAGFSLDEPFETLSEKTKELLFRGSRGEKIEIVLPEGARQGKQHAGKKIAFRGIVPQIEHTYRWYRKQGRSVDGVEAYLQRVMVDHDCPDCAGGRIRRSRSLVQLAGQNLPGAGDLHLVELRDWMRGLEVPEEHRAVADAVLREVMERLDLLIEIGLDYLSMNRRAGTLSGGESQRIRLSTQIGSGLMGMLYVLDEPSIGLHAKDNGKMIATLQKLRDLGNTVVVVEHDEDTIRAADHVLEIGPGPGVHGGTLVASGAPEELLAHPDSLTGCYLRGERTIERPNRRRTPDGTVLHVRGARHNNLCNLDVSIPLGALVCVTGASGSGKSSLLHDTIYKKLASLRYDSRILSGEHDALEGHEAIDDVIDIDQSPIGRSPRSNPATYVGFYDAIRKLYAGTDKAKARGFGPARFSFNVKGGRCEECAGDGTIVTKLSFTWRSPARRARDRDTTRRRWRSPGATATSPKCCGCRSKREWSSSSVRRPLRASLVCWANWVSATWRSDTRPRCFPAARHNGSSWPASSANSAAESTTSTSSTNPRPVCTSPTWNGCSSVSTVWSRPDTLSSSSSTTSTSSPMPTGSSTSAPKAVTKAVS